MVARFLFLVGIPFGELIYVTGSYLEVVREQSIFELKKTWTSRMSLQLWASKEKTRRRTSAVRSLAVCHRLKTQGIRKNVFIRNVL